jgi:hypothetical protein
MMDVYGADDGIIVSTAVRLETIAVAKEMRTF